MERKKLKDSLRNREKLFGAWVSYAEPSITETFAKAGFDFLAIDMEHSTITLPQAQRIIAASQFYNVPCLPRPVSHSNDFFKPLLESGSDGLLVQMVNTTDEVEKIINYLNIHPLGKGVMVLIELKNMDLNLIITSQIGMMNLLLLFKLSQLKLLII